MSQHNQPRRKLLKTMLGTGCAVVTASQMPRQWTRPVIDSVLLPAHAQMSGPEVCTDDLSATLSWTDDLDLNLSMRIPGGLLIGPGTTTGPHSISADVTAAPGGEVASIPCAQALTTEAYQLFVRNNSTTTAATGISLSIVTPVESRVITCTSLAADTQVRVAYVDYTAGQGGVITVAVSPAGCS